MTTQTKTKPSDAFKTTRILGWAMAIAIEASIAVMLWELEPDHSVALCFSAITMVANLLSLQVAHAGAVRKADPREEVRKTAGFAQIAAFILLAPTAFIGGGAVGQKMQIKSAHEFATSDAYQSAKQLANDEMADSRARAEAKLDMERAITPTQVRMDQGSFFVSVLMLYALSVMPAIAVGAGALPKPETPAQAKARLAAVRFAKAQATLAKNRAEAAKVLKAANRGRFPMIDGDRKEVVAR